MGGGKKTRGGMADKSLGRGDGVKGREDAQVTYSLQGGNRVVIIGPIVCLTGFGRVVHKGL